MNVLAVALLPACAAAGALSWVAAHAPRDKADHWRGMAQLAVAFGVLLSWGELNPLLLDRMAPESSPAPLLAGLMAHGVAALWAMMLILGVPATLELWFRKFAEVRDARKAGADDAQ